MFFLNGVTILLPRDEALNHDPRPKPPNVGGKAQSGQPHFGHIRSKQRTSKQGTSMKMGVGGVAFAAMFSACVTFFALTPARAEIASIYGGGDGLCGHRTASGERFNCTAMTAAHRTFPFGTHLVVCHDGCVTVRINDRGPWVRGRQLDLSPAAAHAIGLYKTGHVTISTER